MQPKDRIAFFILILALCGLFACSDDSETLPDGDSEISEQETVESPVDGDIELENEDDSFIGDQDWVDIENDAEGDADVDNEMTDGDSVDMDEEGDWIDSVVDGDREEDEADGFDIETELDCEFCSEAEEEEEEEEEETEPLVIESVVVIENVNSVLSAIVYLDTNRPCRAYIEYGLDSNYGYHTDIAEETASHVLTVVQMKAEREYHLRPVLVNEHDKFVYGEDQTFTTGALPEDLPVPFTVEASLPQQVQPGVTITCPGGRDGSGTLVPMYYTGVDEVGDVVWYYRISNNNYSTFDRDLKPLPNGNLLLQQENGFRVITIGGDNLLNITARQLELSRIHHETIALPNGHFLTLTKQYDTFSVPFDEDPVLLRGDEILEVTPDAEIVWRWSAFDHLDTSRFPTPASQKLESGGGYDWTHCNSLIYQEQDDSILLSIRNQNWILKIDHASGNVIWRMGWQGDFTLTNATGDDSVDWFFGQHSPDMNQGGQMIIFDNGNPGNDDWENNKSRAVIYLLDEQNMLAERVWQSVTPYYNGKYGDADFLPNGNVLICAGGVKENANPNQILEVTGDANAELVWKQEFSKLEFYRATRLRSLYRDQW